MFKKSLLILLLFSLIIIQSEKNHLSGQSYSNLLIKNISIKSVYGKFYAYAVLLFNENPHFVNLIEKDSIPLKTMGNEGFHIKEYKNYLNTIKNIKIYNLAKTLLRIYLEPNKFNIKTLKIVEKKLTLCNIILKFSRDMNHGMEKITLDYCIFGKKKILCVKHPFFQIKKNIYNIQPFIYYDEFSTSNSTFYFDMIYINPTEVHNDYLIAKKIINKQKVDSLFFVGSPVTDDIKFCLKKAFQGKKTIKKHIWEMFVIHEITHKVLNNKFNNFDQVTGEILSLHSTIFSNIHLGLAVMYSYLNYNKINPHRIAAIKYIKYLAEKTNNKEITSNPGIIKNISVIKLKKLTMDHFNLIIKNY